MRKLITTILSVATIAIIFIGCRRTTHNGWIDGNWKIKSVEHIADGEYYDKDTIIYPESAFVSIQLELCQINNYYDGGRSYYTAVMSHDSKNNTIVLDYPQNVQSGFNKWMPDLGFCTNPETFQVEANSKRMTLKSFNSVIICERY